MGNNGWIVIDGERMEAYKGDVLKNRSVAGDYSRLKLECGSNTISWSGDLRQIDVENVSRWI
jgi:phage-related protein